MADAAVLLHVSAIEDALRSQDETPLDLEDMASRLAALAAAISQHSAELSQSTLLKADDIFERFALFAAAALKVEDAIEQATLNTVQDLTTILSQASNDAEDPSEDEHDPEANWDVLRDWFLANIAFPFPELVPPSTLPDPLYIDLDEFEHWVGQVRARSGWDSLFTQFAGRDKRRMQTLCSRAFSSKTNSADNRSTTISKDVQFAFRQVRDMIAAVCSEIEYERQQPAPWMDHLEEMIKELGLSGPTSLVESLDDELVDSTVSSPKYHSDWYSESGTDQVDTSLSGTSPSESLLNASVSPLTLLLSSKGIKRKFEELETQDTKFCVKFALSDTPPNTSTQGVHTSALSASPRWSKKRRLNTSSICKGDSSSALPPARSSQARDTASLSSTSSASPSATSPSNSSSGSESGSPSHSLPTPADYSQSPSPPSNHHSDTLHSNSTYPGKLSKQFIQLTEHSSPQIHSPAFSTHSEPSVLGVPADISISTHYLLTLAKPNQSQVASIPVKQEQVEDELKILPSRPPQEQIFIQRKRKRRSEATEAFQPTVVSITSPEADFSYEETRRDTRNRRQEGKAHRKKASASRRPPQASCQDLARKGNSQLISKTNNIVPKIESDMDNFRPPKRLKMMQRDLAPIPNG